jgi:hypothetical protein
MYSERRQNMFATQTSDFEGDERYGLSTGAPTLWVAQALVDVKVQDLAIRSDEMMLRMLILDRWFEQFAGCRAVTEGFRNNGRSEVNFGNRSRRC